MKKALVGCLALVGAAVLVIVGLVLAGALSMSRAAQERASSSQGPGPSLVVNRGHVPPERADAARDVGVDATCKRAGFGVALWNVKLTNKSTKHAYRDLRYRTTYTAESGTRLRTNRGTFNVVLAPGETRRLEGFNDGLLPQQATACGMLIIGSASELGLP